MLFGTDGIRGRAGAYPICWELCNPLVSALLAVEGRDNLTRVVLGRDTRPSGSVLANALTSEFLARGVDVEYLGVVPSPFVSFVCEHSKADLGIVLTASHNPVDDNGFKFYTREGTKFSVHWEQEVEARVSKFEGPAMSDPSLENVTEASIVSQFESYLSLCQRILGSELTRSNPRCLIDCANGAVARLMPDLCAALGIEAKFMSADTEGRSINKDCGSTHPQRLQSAIRNTCGEYQLGVAFDGDGDRAIFVDRSGELVDGDQILYLLATGALSGVKPQGVIGTKMTNGGLVRALSAHDIAFCRVDVGDRNVAAKLDELGWQMGGETSGHVINTRFAPTGDGILTFLQVYREVCSGATLDELVHPVVKVPQLSVNIPTEDPDAALADAQVQECTAKASEDLEDCRIVIRKSGTEPVIRVMIETDQENAGQTHLSNIQAAIRAVT